MIQMYLRSGNIIVRPCFVWNVCVEISPEFDKEECILRSFFIKFFETTFLFWEFVLDLSDVDWLKEGFSERNRASDINEEMFVVAIISITLLFNVGWIL